jgi:molybdenum cofactor cytidylyltransferase
MKFGPVAVTDAAGAYLAHASEVGEIRLRKGKLLTAEDVAALLRAGVETVIAAQLEAGDVGEDEAAERIARGLAVAGVELKSASTGRVNIHSRHDGVFVVSRPMITALNTLDPGVTIATLAKFARVQRGQMVATVKIIPFAVPDAIVGAAEQCARDGQAFAVHAFSPMRVGLVQTRLPGVKAGVLDKTARVTAERLGRSGSTLAREIRCAHDEAEVSVAIADVAGECGMVIVFGASAMTDSEDVVPSAIRRAGGEVERAGMPVDPGNLLVLGKVGGTVVIGAPGCARSPKDNGFDWVLDRVLAGIAPSSADIAAMGVGGLLMEIPSRPSPREAVRTTNPPRVTAVVLAAGLSSRMGGTNKLLATLDGMPLVRRTAERAVASKAARTIVVTGHMADDVGAAVGGSGADSVFNPDYRSGLASSLRAGLAAAGDTDAIMVLLADMPAVETTHLDRLIAAFTARPDAIIRAASGGRGGNPVILPRVLFSEIARLEGDLGARALIEGSGLEILDVEIGEGAHLDVDTREALGRVGGTVR